MKIDNINLVALRNEEHFQFVSDFKSLVDRFTPKVLEIEKEFSAFTTNHSNELEALNYIAKSSVTNSIIEADVVRDEIYRGFYDAVKSGSNHFKPEIKSAAVRIKLILDQYGNVAKKPNDEETASIKSLYNELTTKHSADINLLNATEWLEELKTANDKFDHLKHERYMEDAGKTLLRMRQTRVETDSNYKIIVEKINALAIVKGIEKYQSFIVGLNEVIASYSNSVAQRKGRNSKNIEVVET